MGLGDECVVDGVEARYGSFFDALTGFFDGVLDDGY